MKRRFASRILLASAVIFTGVTGMAATSAGAQPNEPPAITSGGATTFAEGSPGSFTVTSVGTPTPALSESGALPPGVTFTDNGDGTATLSGTPVVGSAGTYPLTITASNGLSPDDTQPFTLTVDASGSTEMATAPTSSSIVLGNSNSDIATVTGTEGPGSPTGTVSFYQCGPTATPQPCTSTVNQVGGTVGVTAGAGDTATATSFPFTPTSSGYWCFAGYYSGDSSYSGSSDTTTDECFNVIGTSTTPASPSIVLGNSNTDAATVTGSATFGSPTGSVSFYECGPTVSPEPCTFRSDLVGSPVGVTAGPGDSATATSIPFTATSSGYWCFAAYYSGDSNYPASSDTSTDECFFVTGTAATTTTTTPDTSSIVQGQSITDAAAVSGNVTDGPPTGTVTFSLCGPTLQPTSPDPCTGGTDQTSSPVTLSPGPGDASTATSASFTPLSPGFWCFDNTYSGDGNYASSSDDTVDECFDVTPLPNSSTDYAGFAVITNGSGSTGSAPAGARARAGRSLRVTERASSRSSASTTFTVPTETCTSAATGIIVGSGIFSAVSGWVSAAGVVVACQGGVPVYSAQEVVNNAVTNLSLVPAPGDVVTTSVDIVPGQTMVAVDDVTQGVSPTTTVAVGSVGTYISDGIDGDGDPNALPVPDFGAVSFSNSSIDGKTLKAAHAKAISRVTNGDLQILVGPLNSAGTGFGQTFESSGTSVTTTTTTPTASSIVLGQSNTDTATVTGNANGSPTGTVTFSVCGPTATPKVPTPCKGATDQVGSPVGLVPGAGDTAMATSGSFTPDAPGYWCFDNTYSGDANYAPSADDTTDECFDVTPAALHVTTTSLPGATTGVAYSTTLQAGGGTAPYTWKKVSGTLPHGLTLHKRSGIISGTPSASAVTSTFTVKVTDKSHPKQSTTATFTINIS